MPVISPKMLTRLRRRDEDGTVSHGSRTSYLRSMLEGAIGVPFTDGNEITVLRNGVEIFPAMLEAISQTRSTIEFLTFVYWQGKVAREFAAALSERSRAGVNVSVLLDGFGSAKMDKDLIQDMREAGVTVQWFRPVSKLQLIKGNHRTHRKLLVCDGDVAFTGGVGIAEEWEGNARTPGEWRDTHFRIRGPAVRHLQAAFLNNWIETGRPLPSLKKHINSPKPVGKAAIQVVRSTASIGWNDTATLIKVIFTYAKKRIWVTTGFFVVDDRTRAILAEAARRGVDVRIIYPGRYHDSRVSKVAGERKLQPLLDAGVKIFRYQKSMIHAKVMLIDDTFACIGSTNLNQRSLLKDDEVSLALDSPPTVQILGRHFEEDLNDCIQLRKHKWSNRSLWQRAKEIVAAPLHRHV